VGLVTTVVLGICKTACAPLGNVVRNWLPRAGLLGSLAAVALAVIAFLPLSREVAAVPLVGMPTLAVVLVSFMAMRRPPGRVAGALLAVLVGFSVFVATYGLGIFLGQPLVPLGEVRLFERGNSQLPPGIWQWEWWAAVWDAALMKLPIVLPLGLATLVGGLECTESALAAGDEYNGQAILAAQGVATTVAGLCGGVVQTTPYFGHPAYKQMGARAWYVLVAALLLAVVGYSGWFVRALEWLPPPILFPIVVYIGLQTIAHSLQTTTSRDYAAMAFAALPVLAFITMVPLDQALGNRPPHPSSAAHVQTLRCLSNGFIVTSLLWGSALGWFLRGRPTRAAFLMLIAAAFSLVGVIHSPLRGAPLAWPWDVMPKLSSDIRIQCQTPYWWASAYVLTAIVFFVSTLLPVRKESADDEGETAEARTSGKLTAEVIK
jgi:AGZA family xanthine/uracil permease-like MFS transporter